MSAPALGLSEKQIALRKHGIGASEIAAIVGLHPTKRPIDVWLAKQPDAEPFEGNSFTEFGHRIERVIGEAWAERHPGVRIYTPGTLIHPEHDWAMATLDRVVAPEGIGRPARAAWLEALEIKAVFYARGEYGEGADEIPERHRAQVAWQQEVTGLDKITLVALVSGDYREYPIARDPELGGLLLESAERFWVDHVLTGVPPAIDGSEGWTTYLRRKHPEAKAPPLPRTPEAEQAIARLRAAKAAAKAAELAEETEKQAVLALIGDADGVEGLATYRTQKGSTYTVTREPARVLRLTKEKES